MSASTSHAAYEDCYTLFNRALESPRGIAIKFQTYGDAISFRARLNWARILWRRRSTGMYPPDDPNYGISPFDGINVQMPQETENGCWLRLKLRVVPEEIVEIIDDADMQ